jgi:hypothetical protein
VNGNNDRTHIQLAREGLAQPLIAVHNCLLLAVSIQTLLGVLETMGETFCVPSFPELVAIAQTSPSSTM